MPLSFLTAGSFGLVACGAALVWSRAYGIVDPTDDQVVGVACRVGCSQWGALAFARSALRCGVVWLAWSGVAILAIGLGATSSP